MNRTLIAFGSWEERFPAGVVRDLCSHEYRSLVVLFHDTHASRTATERQSVRGYCKARGIEYFEIELCADDVGSCWKKIFWDIDHRVILGDDVTVDLSTMPRDIIWSLFWMLERKGVIAKYVYHCPAEYGSDRLGRNPRPPRMVYKLSGELLPTSETVLLVILGHDVLRATRLIRWYAPKRIIVGIQSEDRLEVDHELMQRHLPEIRRAYNSDSFELDAFSADHGRDAILKALRGVGKNNNVIMSSVGPKLTSVPLYEIQRENPQFGLVYTPANEFSDDYSSGIGSQFGGELNVQTR